MHDLVVRNGTIVDGTGADRFIGDVGIDVGRITEIARHETGDAPLPDGRETIDADGLLVTPGIVDIHTHYDAQIRWDPTLSPSCWYGVTTAVVGNCGVGFAPVRPDDRDVLVDLMEYVEDIPGDVMRDGLRWEWESFPEYLDALDRGAYAMDVATHVTHAALRAYVMGERGVNNEPATPGDIVRMAALVKEGMQAGALGFSTSRTIAHMAMNGQPVPGTYAAEDELFGIGTVLGELATGVFEVAPLGAAGEDATAPLRELDWMGRLSAQIHRPVTFTSLQVDIAPNLWREVLERCVAERSNGAQLFPQVAGRPFGLLLGLQTLHPFQGRPSYEELTALPIAERAARMLDREVRRAILDEADPDEPEENRQYDQVFVLGDPPDYEPGPERSIAALATAQRRTHEEVLYDLLVDDGGRDFFLVPLLNYSEGTAEPLREMLVNPQCMLGLGDGGAHLGMICDASIPTFMLTHWVRDRTRGERIPLELVIRRMTHDTAVLYGLNDRGMLQAGKKADLNVIDFDRLTLRRPEVVHDLPTAGRRIIQRTDGYVATIVNGTVVSRDGEDTGARPGRLIRGAR